MTTKLKPGSVAELVAQFPKPINLTVRLRKPDGEWETRDVTVVELPLDQMVEIARDATPFFGAVPTLANLVALLVQFQEETYKGVGLAIGWPRADVGRLAPGDFLKIALAFWEVNAPFLRQLREIDAAESSRAAPPKPANDGDGPTPSRSSAVTGEFRTPNVSRTASLPPL